MIFILQRIEKSVNARLSQECIRETLSVMTEIMYIFPLISSLSNQLKGVHHFNTLLDLKKVTLKTQGTL